VGLFPSPSRGGLVGMGLAVSSFGRDDILKNSYYAFSTATAQTLNSGVLAVGSSAGLVKQFILDS
jgi:hypothetical protein